MSAPQKPLTLSFLAGSNLLLGVLILAACGTGPDTETFTIRADYPGQMPGTETLPVTLQVKPLSAPTLYGDQRIIWRSSAETRALKTMDNRLWSEAPPRLIQTEIMRCLSASKLVKSVVPEDVQVDFDYALSGEVRELLVETQGESHQAFVAFDVFVTQRRPRRLLWSGNYRHREETADQTAQGFVNAVEKTLETLCVQITTDLRRVLSG